MIANLFSKSKPINVFSISLLLFGFYLTNTLLNESIVLSLRFFANWIGFFVLLLLILAIFKFIVEKNKLTKDNSYALLIVVFILGTFSNGLFSSAVVFSNLTLLLAFRKIYSLKSGLNINGKLFDAAFWIGIATLIYSWNILYVLLIYVGIFIYKKNSLKNLVIPLVGVATPVFIYFTYNFYFDSLNVFYERLNYDVNFDFEIYKQPQYLIPIIFLVVTLLWSIVTVTPRIITVSNNMKFSWLVILNHLFISTIVVVISPIKNSAELFYLAIPSAVIIANLLQKSKSSIFKNVMLYLFLIIAVAVNFL